MGQLFLSVAGYVVKPEVQKFKREKKCQEQKETRCFQRKTAGFVELLSRFELETSSLPTAIAIFFAYYSFIYSRFCSVPFAFRHSLNTVFPCIPRLSVAGYVVKPATAGPLHVRKPAAVILTDRLHQCLQRRIPNTAA